MDNIAKYVITALYEPILFPPTKKHSDMVCAFEKPIAAGFVRVKDYPGMGMVVRCHGCSVSLGVESRPEQDAKLIEDMLRGRSPFL